MYSAEVVQKVLQRRQPWKRAEWLPSEVDNDQLRAVIEADPPTATRSSSSHKKLLKNSKLTILRSFSIWSTFTRWKRLISGCLMSQVQKKKTQNHRFEVSSYSVQHQQTISQSDCDMWRKVDFIQQLKMTSSVVGLRSSKALPKAKLTPKKGHGHCLAVCCPYDPLYLSKTTISEKYAQQIDEMQWKHFYNQQEAENAFQELSES